MNRKRAVRAAGAGLVATGIFLASLLIIGAAVFFGFLAFSPGAGTGIWWVVVPAVVVVLIVVGAALPARALGAGWWRSLMVSGVAVGILALVTPFLAANAEGLFVLFYLFAFVTPAFIAVAASAGNGLSLTGLASVVALTVLSFLAIRLIGFSLLPDADDPASAAFVQGTVMVAIGWALLPALAGLFQRSQA